MEQVKVKKENIKDYSHAVEVFGQHGMGYNKSLMARITFYPQKLQYMVIDHREIKLVVDDLDKAIDFYNTI